MADAPLNPPDRTCASPRNQGDFRNLSLYPGAYDYTLGADVRQPDTVIHEDHINRLQDAVFNLQCLLGVQPLDGLPNSYPNLKAVLQDLSGVLPDPSNPPPEVDIGIDYSGLVVEDAGPSTVRVRCTEANVFRGDALVGEDDVAVDLVADLSHTGPGGRVATGAVPGPNQWWEVHLIGASDGTRPLALYLIEATMTSQSVPPPSGYDVKTRVAAVCTDGSGSIRPFLQVDNRIYYEDSISAWGASVAAGVWTRASLAHLVSPFSREVMLAVRISRGGGPGSATMNVRFPGAKGERGVLSVQTGNSTSDTDFANGTIPTDADRAIEYRVGGTATPLDAEGMVIGYIDRYVSSVLD